MEGLQKLIGKIPKDPPKLGSASASYPHRGTEGLAAALSSSDRSRILLNRLARPLPFSSLSSSDAAADAAAGAAAVDDNNDGIVNIPPLREKYDVFISFRGEDTRLAFTSHLHAALRGKKIETYIDYRLERGDKIGSALRDAIEKSRLSVIIFSKNYASSTWCLIELVHILKCKKKNCQMVVPIFYDISPSDVRKQKESFADAFTELENRFKDRMDKVIEWKAALEEATGLSGFDYSNKKRTEADFIEEVVEDISAKLKRETSYGLKGMFAIESRIKQVESLLSTNDWQGVCTVGIWGMGGIGKTTLARAVFTRLSFKFDASCFLSNVTEKAQQTDGVNKLQKELLKEILKEKILSIDSTSVRERLGRTKVLIVFDDVSDSGQIKDLAGDYGDGSRIIVTSREQSVLEKAVSDEKYIYEVEKIENGDGLQLFQFHAFKDNSPREEYTELSARVVEYAGGIPLALKVLGSLFFECKSKDEWEDLLRTLRYCPNEEIQNRFRVSYNRLGRNAQEVFLDIACFYKGRHIKDVKKMVDFGQLHGGSCAADGIRVLHKRSLISINSEWETIDMHDLVQEMGWEIVREQCSEEPGRRSRLFIDEDVYHVLKNNTGTEKVQAIFSPWSRIGEQNLDRADFKKMYNMRLLRVSTLRWCSNFETLSLPNSLRYLFWEGYPLKSLPSNFSPENLVELHMPYSQVDRLWNDEQRLVNLKVINLEGSSNLTEVPNLSGSREIVLINLLHCQSLVKIPGCFQHLHKLTFLNLGYCKCLKYLPEMPENIEILNLHASGIQELPESVWSHEKISYLAISSCGDLEKLPGNKCKLKVSGFFDLQNCTSLGQVFELPRNISRLSLAGCKRLLSLPIDICKLKSLKTLSLVWCSKLGNFPEILEPMEHLEYLNLKGTAIQELHSSIEFLPALKTIELEGCKRLSSIPESICKLKSLKTLNLCFCSELGNFPEILEPMEHLEYLNLTGTAIQELHSSIKFLPALKTIELQNCKRLSSIPESICKLKSLKTLNLCFCSELGNFPKIFEPMEHLEYLNLRGTAIQELHSSIEFLPALKTIELEDCKRLSSISESICKLKSLPTLDLKSCFSFYKFPQILEPMEHLNLLSLKGTAVEELPSSIGNLIGLETLDLDRCKKLCVVPGGIYSLTNLKTLSFRDCSALKELPSGSVRLLSLKDLDLHGTSISEIPDGLVGSTSLQDLDLSRSMIRSIPASIKQASRLHTLSLIGCRTLDHNARSNMMDEAQLGIMRVATNSSYGKPWFGIDCPGKEIPKWFSFNYQSKRSSVHIKLPSDFFRTGLLGFALSVVVSCASDCTDDFEIRADDLEIRARCNVESLGESHELFTSSFDNFFTKERNRRYLKDHRDDGWNRRYLKDQYLKDHRDDGWYRRYLKDHRDDGQDHVFVWYKAFISKEVAEKCSPYVYKLANEASVEFHLEADYPTPVMVKKCGICPLYVEDVEKFKLISGEPKIQEETRDIRKQKGSYADAFAQHENREDTMDKVIG